MHSLNDSTSLTVLRTTLAHGMKIIHIPLENDPRLYIGAIFKTGARFDGVKKSGCAHFLEHMMFRGSKNFPSFLKLSDAFEYLGGEWNAATGYEYTEYTFHGSAKYTEQALNLFSEFIQEPLLLDLERERQVIVREIEDETNEFGHFTDTSIHMSQLIWGNASVAQPITGTTSSLKNITLDDLWKFRREYYHPSNLVLCIVGGKATDVLTCASSLWSGYPEKVNFESKDAIPAITHHFVGPQCRWIANSDSQYHFQMSFVCEGEWSDKSSSYQLLTRILADGYSSKLTLRLREELGLVYDVTASVNQLTDCGTFDIHAAASLQDIYALVREVCTILRELKISQEDLEKAKLRSFVEMELLPSSPESLGFRVSWHALWGKNPSLADEKKEIEDISLSHIKDIAKDLFQKTRVGLVVLGPQKHHLEESLIDILQKNLP